MPQLDCLWIFLERVQQRLQLFNRFGSLLKTGGKLKQDAAKLVGLIQGQYPLPKLVYIG